ncbi:hypothetical protein E4U58_000301 [Claviceps cyperi]|nr:hypothetical protein E4U58_000301 [Claviceps cyperi]
MWLSGWIKVIKYKVGIIRADIESIVSGLLNPAAVLTTKRTIALHGTIDQTTTTPTTAIAAKSLPFRGAAALSIIGEPVSVSYPRDWHIYRCTLLYVVFLQRRRPTAVFGHRPPLLAIFAFANAQ